jgi:hemoglobin
MPRRGLLCLLLASVAGCMEGTKPEKERQEREVSLYERLGKEAGIAKVVDDFVEAVVKNAKYPPNLKDHFKRPDVAVLKRKLVDQIGEATGGPQKYTGKNMKDAHKGLGITEADFNALVASLTEALTKNRVGEKEQHELLGLLGPMKSDVVEGK